MKKFNEKDIFKFIIITICVLLLCSEEIGDIIRSCNQNLESLKFLIFLIFAVVFSSFTSTQCIKIKNNNKKKKFYIIITILIYISLYCYLYYLYKIM